MSINVLSAVVGAVPATIAACAAVIAARRGNENKAALIEVRTVGDQVVRQTNGEMEAKIRRAVMEVFAEHRGEVTEAVMAESVRHLLNAMINPDSIAPYPSEKS